MLRSIKALDAEFVVQTRGQHGQRFVNRQAGSVGQPVHPLEGTDHAGGIHQGGLAQPVDDRGPGLGKLIGIGQCGIGKVEKFAATNNAAVSRPIGGGDRIAWGAVELAVLTEQE